VSSSSHSNPLQPPVRRRQRDSAAWAAATGAGTTDTARERTIDLEAAVKAAGIKSSYKEIPGRHYWFLWRDFLGDYAQLLFK
jgi:S-formylglutathione hydrolase FrmB